jgi:plastocyanin
LSVPSSSHAYGIGLIAVLVGTGVGVVYYQMYYIPEYNAKPHFDDPKILNPGQTITITIVTGSSIQGNPQYFVPAKQAVQLGVSNLVLWQNNDNAVHFVTIDPTSNYKDRYSGNLDSPPIGAGKSFNFLFTQQGTVKYYCKVHTWMTGEIDVVTGAKTS